MSTSEAMRVADLAAMSSRGLRRMVESSHYIQFGRPDVVIRAVREVVGFLRQNPSVERVIFAAFSNEVFSAYESALARELPLRHS